MATIPTISMPIPPAGAGTATTANSTLTAPSVKLTLEPGETTIDDKLAFEVDLACYAEMERQTAAVRRQIDARLKLGTGAASAGPVHLFFLDSALRSALDISATIELQLANLKQAYAGAEASAQAALAAIKAPAPGPELESVAPRPDRSFSVFSDLVGTTAIADAAVALIGALRTDTRYFGRQVIIPEQAFALALAHEWESSEKVQFHYPTLFLPATFQAGDMMRDLVNAFDAAVEKRNAASRALSSLLARVSQLGSGTPEFLAAKPSLDTARDQFEAAEAVFDQVSTQLTKSDETTGLTQLQLLERAAFVKTIAKEAKEANGKVFYLFAQVVTAGGAFRITKNFFRMLFGRDGLEHAGGCIVTFGLFDDAGRLVASNTIGGRSAYQDSRPALQLRG